MFCYLEGVHMQLLNQTICFRIILATLGLGASVAAGVAAAGPDITVKYLAVDKQSEIGFISISADARYAAYALAASGTVNIMVHDLVDNTRVQANLLPDGSLPTNGQCTGASISADARYVVFGCNSQGMGVPVATGSQSFFVYDRVNNKTDVVPRTTSDSVDKTIYPTISADGRYVAYRTFVTDYRIFVRDMQNKTTRETSAKYANLGVRASSMNISSDGRYVSYSGFGTASKSVQGASVYDTASGVTEVVNINAAGAPSGTEVRNVSMSSDGSVFAFQSTDVNLSTPAAPSGGGIFVRDRRAGRTEFISGNGVIIRTSYVAVSPDGRYVSYVGVRNSTISELYVHDRATKITRTIPTAFIGGRSASASQFSTDSRYLVFHSRNITSEARAIGIADLGVGAGLSLSSATVSLTEGGAAATYTLALRQAPAANVLVAVTPDTQLSVARTQLTFTPDNWNVPQVVSVQALQDSIAEGLHSGTVTHTVSSSDIEYAVVAPLTVTAAISDAIVPTLLLPGVTWNRTDLPLTGTAAPGATVLLTASNRNTGWLTSVSAVADAQGKWSHTLTGLSDGVIEFDVQADGVHGVLQTITVVLPPTFTDVTGSITTLGASMAYNRATGKYVGNFVLTNTGGGTLTGPLQLQLNNLTAGIALSNASGSHDGMPYITVQDGLLPGASVTIPLVFDNPGRVAFDFDAKIFNGSF
jgi:hypothetical protein